MDNRPYKEILFQILCEKADEVVVMASWNNKVVYLNKSARKIFGFAEQIVNKFDISEMFDSSIIEDIEGWKLDASAKRTVSFEIGEGVAIDFEIVEIEQRSFYLLKGKRKNILKENEETVKLLKLLNEEKDLDGDNLTRLLASQNIDKLKLISENTYDVVCLHYPEDARYLYVSPSTEKIMGYTAEDLAGKVPYDFIHPDHLKFLKRNLSETSSGKLTFPEKLELLFRVKNNTYQWFEGYSKPILNNKKEVILILSCTRNIQDRKLAEIEKKEREIIQQNLLSSSILLEKKKLIMEKMESKVLELEPLIRQELRSVLAFIRETLKFDDDWEDFMVRFKNIHPDFYKNVLSSYPHLTKADLQYIAFMKLGMTSSEIAKTMIIKKESLRVIKNRLKKKLKLDQSQDLIWFIQNF